VKALHVTLLCVIVNTTQHDTTQLDTTQHDTTQHDTTRHDTTQHNTTQLDTTQHNTTRHNSTRHNTTRHNSTRHDTTQHNSGKLQSVAERVSSKFVMCDLMYLINPHVSMLQVRPIIMRANDTTETILPWVINCFPLYFTKYSAYRTVTHVKVSHHNEICIFNA
jgi:hypothetical protein